MEPRPHERGKHHRSTDHQASSRLQWSHVLTNVERLRLGRGQGETMSASMEPRPHERGKRSSDLPLAAPSSSFNGATSSRTWKDPFVWVIEFSKTASMEPRPHERGKLPLRAAISRQALRLQWSHVLTNVESFAIRILYSPFE